MLREQPYELRSGIAGSANYANLDRHAPLPILQAREKPRVAPHVRVSTYETAIIALWGLSARLYFRNYV